MKQLMDMNFAKLRDKAGISERWGLWKTPPQPWESVMTQISCWIGDIDFPTRKINLHFDYPPGNKHSPSKGNCEDEFPFLHWWDMLVPWRVVLKSPSDHNITSHCEKPIACDRSVLVLAATLPGLFPNENLYSRYSLAFLPLVWVLSWFQNLLEDDYLLIGT